MKQSGGVAAPGKNGVGGTMIGFGHRGQYIPERPQLAEVVKALRTIGAKIVLTQGTFDFIHIGHFLYLEKAREMGDVLIVGVDSDEKVRSRKGPDRPVVNENERIQMLTHVRHVDVVTIKHTKDPKWSLIKLIKPDVLVATKETYTNAQIKELKKYCGKVLVLEPQATTSTTAKMRRLNIGLSRKIRDAITESINETFDKLVTDA
jgi:D-beta-D-heptose 7-phosphate kinase/D-beta-D-heptose 1-phosphate adenosyltransferase